MDPLTVLIVVLLVAWLLGAFGGFALGNAVHILLVVVLVLVAIRLMRGQSL